MQYNKCPKCQGLCLEERYYSLQDNEFFYAYRCLNCGNMIDEIIMENRNRRIETPKPTYMQIYYAENKEYWVERREQNKHRLQAFKNA